MKIALIIPGFSDGEQDWCIPFALNLVRGLVHAGDEVAVFAMRYPPRRDTYPVFGATVHAIGGNSEQRGAERFGLWLRTLRTIASAHRAARFDVIHSIWADEGGLVATLAERFLSIPSVVSITGGELASFKAIRYGLQLTLFSRWIVRRALRDSRAVIALCETTAAPARPLAGPDRLKIAAMGVDPVLFSPPDDSLSAAAARPPTLLAAGSLIPVKNHAALIRMLAGLRTAGVELTLAGSGSLESALREQAAVLGVTDRVHFKGAVTHDQMPDVYRSAGLHVLPSLHEGFGMVILEAAACGVPTVGYRVGFMSELERAGAGIAVEPGDEAAFAGAVERLLADPARRTTMGAAARRLVLENYSVEAMVERLRAVYRSVLRG